MDTSFITISQIRASKGRLYFDITVTDEEITNFDLNIRFAASDVANSENAFIVNATKDLVFFSNRQGPDELAIAGFTLNSSKRFTKGTRLFSLVIELANTEASSLGVELSGTYNENGQLSSSRRILSPQQVSVVGTVLDGYVEGASIYLDANGNGVADPSEDTGLKTDALGRFSGKVLGEGSLIAMGGVNTDTGLTNALPLAAPSGSSVISPLTTLVQQVVKSTGVAVAQASASVNKSLGLPSAVDLLQFDPLVSAQSSEALAVQKANVQVATAISVAGVRIVEAIASEIVSIAASSNTLDLSSEATLKKIAPAVSASTIQRLASANSSIQAAGEVAQIAQSQKAALIASRRAGTDANDILQGEAGDDVLSAGKGKDRLIGGLGSDKLDGGDGIDTAVFEKARSAYKTEKLVQDGTTLWKVTDLATGDVDELRNIEKLEFAVVSSNLYQNPLKPTQTEINLDTTGTAAVAYRVYKAAFAREPDFEGLGYWVSVLDQYLDPKLSPEKNPFLLDIAKTFVESSEFKTKYGKDGKDVANDGYVLNLYLNALGRDPRIPDAQGKLDPGYPYWVDVLNKNNASRSDLFVYFSESAENKAAVAQVIATGIEYVPLQPPGT